MFSSLLIKNKTGSWFYKKHLFTQSSTNINSQILCEFKGVLITDSGVWEVSPHQQAILGRQLGVYNSADTINWR